MRCASSSCYSASAYRTSLKLDRWKRNLSHINFSRWLSRLCKFISSFRFGDFGHLRIVTFISRPNFEQISQSTAASLVYSFNKCIRRIQDLNYNENMNRAAVLTTIDIWLMAWHAFYVGEVSHLQNQSSLCKWLSDWLSGLSCRVVSFAKPHQPDSND